MTYEYLCEACGHAWEAQQPISADPLKDCPSCGEARAKRQISRGAGFILKGGGWYSDLYSSTKSSSGGSDSDSSSSSSSSTSSSSTSTSSSDAGSKSAAPAAASTPAKSD